MRSVNNIINPERNNFTLIRILAAFAVVLSHTMELKTGDASNAILGGVAYYNLGDLAVNVFFVLSGLMVSASLDRSRSYASFIVSRLLRIFPGLIVCTLVLALIAGPLLSTLPKEQYFDSSEVLGFVVKTLLTLSANGTLPGVFSEASGQGLVNPPVWTLKYEIACYFVLVGLSAIGVFNNRKAMLGITLASWLAILVYFLWLPDGRLATAGAQIARFWLCFSAGVLTYQYRQSIPLHVGLAAIATALWFLSLHTVAERFVSPLAAGYLSLCLGALPCGPLRHWANDYDLSYGIYIYGWPITQVLVRVWPSAGVGETLLAACVLSGMAAIISWLLVERPATRIGRFRMKRGPGFPEARA